MRVVIVNYRSGPLIVACLDSLASEVVALPGLTVTVVDNASGDGSDAIIAAAITARGWGGWARLIRSPVNGGFAAGNNVAIRAALAEDTPPELFWLLNPDTRVVAGAACALTRFFAAKPEAGIVGTALIEGDGTPWPYAFRFPSILSEIERGARLGPVSRLLARRLVLRRMHSAAPVDWVSGASMAVRRDLIDTIGLMDEGYFLYFEETDFCRRAHDAGRAVWYLPDAAVVHIAGQSTGMTGSRPTAGRVPGYWFDSRRRYFIRNHGRLYAMLADLAWAAAHLSWRLRRRWARRDEPDPPGLLGDFLRRSALVRTREVRPQ